MFPSSGTLSIGTIGIPDPRAATESLSAIPSSTLQGETKWSSFCSLLLLLQDKSRAPVCSLSQSRQCRPLQEASTGLRDTQWTACLLDSPRQAAPPHLAEPLPPSSPVVGITAVTRSRPHSMWQDCPSVPPWLGSGGWDQFRPMTWEVAHHFWLEHFTTRSRPQGSRFPSGTVIDVPAIGAAPSARSLSGHSEPGPCHLQWHEAGVSNHMPLFQVTKAWGQLFPVLPDMQRGESMAQRHLGSFSKLSALDAKGTPQLSVI